MTRGVRRAGGVILRCPSCAQEVELFISGEVWCSRCDGRPHLEEVGKDSEGRAD
jgi:hypothetical protein